MAKNTDPKKVVSLHPGKENLTGKEKWKAMAGQPNARVILCNTPEAYAMADLARSADMGLNLMRKRLMVTIDSDEALPLMEEFNRKVIELEETISTICKKVNARHRMPKNIVSVRKQMGMAVEEDTESAGEAKKGAPKADAEKPAPKKAKAEKAA